MGFDQYAFKVKNQPNLPAVDCVFSEWNEDTQDWVNVVPKDDFEEIHYFRKHHDLQGWMQNLYNQKGGTNSEFNCNKVELNLDDLDNLESDVKNNTLPHTNGFFFGSGNTEGYKHETLEFVQKCRDVINEGYRVFYDSWW